MNVSEITTSPSDDAESSALTITHTHEEGTLIEGTSRGDGTAEILKREGWRWGRSIAAWYVPHSRDRLPNPWKIQRTVAALRVAGFTVAMSIATDIRPTAEVEVAKIERQADRVDALDAKAERKAAAEVAADERAAAAFGRLPEGGEPIKVGHHSEGRHRNAIAKAHAALGRSVEAGRDAERARGRADAARITTDARYSPVTVANRIEKLGAELRQARTPRDGRRLRLRARLPPRHGRRAGAPRREDRPVPRGDARPGRVLGERARRADRDRPRDRVRPTQRAEGRPGEDPRRLAPRRPRQSQDGERGDRLHVDRHRVLCGDPGAPPAGVDPRSGISVDAGGDPGHHSSLDGPSGAVPAAPWRRCAITRPERSRCAAPSTSTGPLRGGVGLSCAAARRPLPDLSRCAALSWPWRARLFAVKPSAARSLRSLVATCGLRASGCAASSSEIFGTRSQAPLFRPEILSPAARRVALRPSVAKAEKPPSRQKTSGRENTRERHREHHQPQRGRRAPRPNTLIIEENVRPSADLNRDFVRRIRETGVSVPVVARRDADGRVLVRAGQRRTLGAREAAVATIPVYVIDADDATAHRIVQQLVENDHRQALTDADRTVAFKQLSLAGLSPATIARRTGTKAATVKTTLQVANTPAAADAKTEHQLTLDQAAGLVEFDDDEEPRASLIAAACQTPEQFDHALQRARDERARREALQAAIADHESRGYVILDPETPSTPRTCPSTTCRPPRVDTSTCPPRRSTSSTAAASASSSTSGAWR